MAKPKSLVKKPKVKRLPSAESIARRNYFSNVLSKADPRKALDRATGGKIRTKTIDRGYNAIIQEMKVLEKKPFVKVGFPKESAKTNEKHKDENGKDSDLTVLDVAVFHEFGTERLPPRSFMRASHDKMAPEINAAIKRLYKGVMEGKLSVSRALSIIGLLVERETKRFLTSNSVKPPSKKGDFSLVKFSPVVNSNAKAPRKDKRNSYKTLIDTAQMLNSITFVKVMNGLKK